MRAESNSLPIPDPVKTQGGVDTEAHMCWLTVGLHKIKTSLLFFSSVQSASTLW